MVCLNITSVLTWDLIYILQKYISLDLFGGVVTAYDVQKLPHVEVICKLLSILKTLTFICCWSLPWRGKFDEIK